MIICYLSRKWIRWFCQSIRWFYIIIVSAFIVRRIIFCFKGYGRTLQFCLKIVVQFINKEIKIYFSRKRECILWILSCKHIRDMTKARWSRCDIFIRWLRRMTELYGFQRALVRLIQMHITLDSKDHDTVVNTTHGYIHTSIRSQWTSP